MKQPYLTYREMDNEGRLCYYICQKASPNYVGIVSVGTLYDRIANAPVGDYNLYVNFNGTIQGHYAPSYKDVIQDIERCMWEMANWFYKHRVLAEPKKYLKFKIKQNELH